MSARSEGPGRGAEFVVRMPALSAVVAAGAAPDSEEPPVVSAEREEPRLGGLNVLVVDDEEDARLIVEQVLRDGGANVLTAESAPQALGLLLTKRPDVVVCDVGMPEMDGYTLLRQVRALPPDQGGRTPALALTAYARQTISALMMSLPEVA